VPRPRKAPRLYLRKRAGRDATWVIRDGSVEISTGCAEPDLSGAEQALSRYIAAKWQPPSTLNPSELYIAEILAAYLTKHAPHVPSAEWLEDTAKPIAEWWGDKRLSEVTGENCRQYVAWRTSQTWRRAKTPKPIAESTARHELKTLRTAINWYHKELGPLPSVPAVTLPPAPPQRVDYWLTRQEVARRIRAARSDPLRAHIARFLLIGVYSGTRPGAILGLKWIPSTTSGWFDLEAGVLHRRGTRARRSRKRQPPAKIHARLLPHLKRWRAMDMANGITTVVHYQGQPIKKLRRSWSTTARIAAGVPEGDTTWQCPDGPHIVRHTAATWLMQAGVDIFEAAGFLGMTPETLWQCYGHHHPDFQANAAQAVPRKRPRNG